MIKNYAGILVVMLLLCACNNGFKYYDPNKKYSPDQLRQDYYVLQNILQKKHPALYWYTPKDSMDAYFNLYKESLQDSMTELQFGWNVVAPLIKNIRCGHTAFSMSKNWDRFVKDKRIPTFPLYLKVWKDTMVVMGNLNKTDSDLVRGTQVTSINGESAHNVIEKMFNYLPQDGYADNVNYIRLSGNFPYYHRNIYGTYKRYKIGFTDSNGVARTKHVPVFIPEVDSSALKKKKIKEPKIPKKIRIENYRSIVIDTPLNTAVITLNTFQKGGGKHLRHFFKTSFKKIKEQHIGNVVLDLRSNGGGDVYMFVLLAKYLKNKPFRVCDTTYSISKSLKPYTKYVKHGLLNNIGLFLLTKKRRDHNFHYGFWEKHYFHPKKKYHFDSTVYVLTNGFTFSASTLFCNSVKGQNNITLIGEETGGGAYGNTGILIPDIILPNTKIRVRLPLFKLIQFNHPQQTAKGIMPDIYVGPTIESVKQGVDRKMEFVKDLIKRKQSNP